jgi:hypothetical protein
VCAAGGVSGTAQSTEQSTEKEKRMVLDRIPKHLPIKVRFKNPEKALEIENDNWLADMEIEVKNTGAKPIYFLSIFLDFVDDNENWGNKTGYQFTYGRGKLLEIDQRATPEDVPLPPGETHVFKLHEDYVKGWNWYRTQVMPTPQPKKVRFFFSTLSFGDGTGYVTTGGIYKNLSNYKKLS